jgi:GNAT superfamily N-acetyltransferase
VTGASAETGLADPPPGRAGAVGERLVGLLADVAAGRFPPADLGLEVLPRPPGGRLAAAVVGLTAYTVVAADVDAGWVREQLRPLESLSLRMGARFLTALGDRVGADPGNLDVLLLAPPGPVARTPGDLGLTRLDDSERRDHRRLVRARLYRDDIRAYAVAGALLLLGRGLGGRWEVAVEVDDDHQGRGLARRLVAAAPALVPPGQPLWAQISPGNVASVRAFLAAGYRPVGAEVLFRTAH